jgi:DNA-binding response OmpR family regulator
MDKILIIEDDPDIMDIIKMALADKYIVKGRTDNEDLPTLMADFLPDLIIIDYFIGQKKATEILKEIKSVDRSKHLPFILLSGHYDIERLAREMGAASWLSKPFVLSKLYSCIDEVMSEL